MKECFVTIRDVRTKFNPLFLKMKIKNVQDNIEEMYHAGTTVTCYYYDIGRITTRSYSAEEVAISIIEKREHLDVLVAKFSRYLDINYRALSEFKNYRDAQIVECFQSDLLTYDEVGKEFNLSRNTISIILDKYMDRLSVLLTKDDMDDIPITHDEIKQLSDIIEQNAMYVPKPRNVADDPLHGMTEWHHEDSRKRAERNRKHRAEISAV